MLDDRIHLVQHMCFAGTAMLFWWGLIRGRYGRLGYGAAMMYIFATAVHSQGLGALLTFSARPWYPLYVELVMSVAGLLTTRRELIYLNNSPCVDVMNTWPQPERWRQGPYLGR